MRRAIRSKKITAVIFALLIMACMSSAASIRNIVFVKGNGKKDRNLQFAQSVQPGFGHASAKQAYASLPLMFEANEGQVDLQVHFIARTSGQTIFITSRETVIVARNQRPVENGKLPDIKDLPNRDARPTQTSIIRMKYEGANSDPKIHGGDKLSGTVNWLIGDDQKQWRTDIPTYGQVSIDDVYRGIDLVYYGNQTRLEYDFIVSPGSDPSQIRMSFEGAERIKVDRNGDLVLTTAVGEIRQLKPTVYQQEKGVRREIASAYVIGADDEVSFRVGSYDRTAALVIDPTLAYVAAVGGAGNDSAWGIAADPQGNTYITGFTDSDNFPALGAVQQAKAGSRDVFVTKLNAAGSARVYSTYIGGAGNEAAYSIAVDAVGNAYVTGSTVSNNFPRANAVQTNYGGGTGDAFVFKLNAAGSALLYSTFLGGSQGDFGYGIGLDSTGNAYATGYTFSTNFPTKNAIQTPAGFEEVFLTKLDPNGTSLLFSTYIGGSFSDIAFGIAVDSSGNSYITGVTTSPNYPTTAGSFKQGYLGGIGDSFVTKVSATGTIVYSTFYGGGGYDWGYGIAVDANGSAAIAGFTNSPVLFVVFPAQNAFGGGASDAYIAKLSPAGNSLVFSTYLGSGGDDIGNTITTDPAGNIYVGGGTTAAFPELDPIVGGFGGGGTDAFVTKFTPAGAIVYSSMLGGTGADVIQAMTSDRNGSVYMTGATASSVFRGATTVGGSDAFVTKIAGDPATPFSFLDRGGVSLTGSGTGTNPTIGYARILANTGSTVPAGLAIFGLRVNGTIVSEAAVPASPLVQSGRIYAEVNGPVNTGLALANPSNQAVTISFYFTDENGQDFGQSLYTLPAQGQVAAFLNEAPFNGGSSVRGTFTFTANVPISVVALRGFTNERGEFLITTLPVSSVGTATSDVVIFPHFAEGGGWTTQVILVNPTNDPMNGTVQFFDQGKSGTAAPVQVNVNGIAGTTIDFAIPARTSRRLQTSGLGAAAQIGSVRVTPAGGSKTPTGLGVFTYKTGGFTVSEAGVPALRTGNAFRMYVEASGNFSQAEIGSLQSGLAITNSSVSSATVNFELTTLNGSSTGLSGSLAIPPQGQVATFLGEIAGFQSLPANFQGVLRISSNALVSVVGLRGRYNERRDFLITTTTPVLESDLPATTESLFPHLVVGGGYTTQFILYSGATGQTGSGNLRFLSQTGQALNLTLN